MQVRNIAPHGHFSLQGKEIFLSETLRGERVGLQQTAGDRCTIYFARFPIAVLDLRKLEVKSWSSTEGY
jgi:hypothetical protein